MDRPLVCLAAFVLSALALGCGGRAEPNLEVSAADTPRPTTPEARQVRSAGGPSEEPPADIVAEEPSAARPVVVGAALRPARVRPGDMLTLYVQARIAPTWHIYPAESPAGANIPTTLKLHPTAGIEPAGSWTYPQARASANGSALLYEGTVTFRRQLRVAASAAPGALEVGCEFGYQACDPFSCRPPTSSVVKASVEVVTGE